MSSEIHYIHIYLKVTNLLYTRGGPAPLNLKRAVGCLSGIDSNSFV